MRLLSLSILTAFVLNSTAALANEKPAEGDEGEGGKGAATVSKDTKEFLEKSARLTSLTSRIEEHRKHFSEAVHNKAEAKDPVEKQRWIKDMIQITNDMNKDIEAYNRVKSDLILRYPNKGEQLERRYQTQTKRTMEEMEGAAGLDELLTRTKKAIDKKYAPFREEEEKRTHAQPEIPAGEEEKPKRLRLER